MNAKRILIISAVILSIGVICFFAGCERDVYVYSVNKCETDTIGRIPKTGKDKVNLKFYLECSASMNGYMDHSGTFKDAINECLSVLNSTGNFDTIQLNYIGQEVHLFNSNFTLNQTESLLNEFLNPSYYEYNKANVLHIKDSKNAISGITYQDRNYSKLSEILDTIIGRTKEDVSVLVSDCILDPYDGQPENYLALCKTDIYNLFQKVLKKNPDLAVQIIQLNSKFVGPYYYKELNVDAEKNGKKSITQSIQLNGTERPYYIWIIANRDRISKFNDRLSRLKDHNANKASINSVIFAPGKNIAIDVKTGNVEGKLKEQNGFATFKIIADLSNLLIEDLSWITNKENYVIEVIRGAKNVEFDTVAIDYDTISRKISLPIKLNKVQPNMEIMVRLKTKDCGNIPQWVNDVNGINAQNDALNIKTTGLKSLIEGVATAYDDYNGDYITEFIIKTSNDRPKDNKKQQLIKQAKSKQKKQ